MLQLQKAVARKAKRKSADGRLYLDPATIKERFYALELKGDCLDPVFKEGDVIVVDRDGRPTVGGYGVFYYRPELVPPGRISPSIKRLVTAVPPTELPYRLAPGSDCAPCIMVEQLNPAQRWYVMYDHLLAVHLAVATMNDPDLERKLQELEANWGRS